MKLGEYLNELCWSQADLARAAKVSTQSVGRALAGRKLSRRGAAQIVGAIAQARGEKMILSDISDLRVVSYKRRQAKAAAENVVAETPPRGQRSKKQSDQAE